MITVTGGNIRFDRIQNARFSPTAPRIQRQRMPANVPSSSDNAVLATETMTLSASDFRLPGSAKMPALFSFSVCTESRDHAVDLHRFREVMIMK